MSTISVEVKGVKRLLDKAGRLEPNARRNVARALTVGALRIEADAKRRAPVDTGRLRASIVHEAPDAAGSVLEAVVSTNVEYARYQEFGTSRMRAQPFMFPAAEANKAAILADIREALREALDD